MAVGTTSREAEDVIGFFRPLNLGDRVIKKSSKREIVLINRGKDEDVPMGHMVPNRRL